MESIERVAKTVEEAVDLALEQLGKAKEEVIIEILEEPKKGVFGVGEKLARVRVSERTADSEVKLEDKAEGTGTIDLRKNKSSAMSTSMKQIDSIPAESVIIENEDDSDENSETTDGISPDDNNEDFDRIKSLINLLGFEIEVKGNEKEVNGQKIVFINLNGPDAKYLIGKEGQTLEALQLIVNNIQSTKERRVIIDVGQYKEKRVRKAVEMAKKKAYFVKKNNRKEEFRPMKSFERRAIHEALADDPAITTHSEGKGQFRYLIIEPANNE